MYQITIRPVLNGFIVSVGCQVLVFTSREILLKELEAYLRNPKETQERFLESAMHTDYPQDKTPFAQIPTAERSC